MPGGQGNAPQGTPDAAAKSTQQAAPAATQDTTQVDAVVAQIEAAMTSDQLTAIAALNITTTSAEQIIKDKGITAGGPQGNGGTAPAQGSSNNGQQANGNAPAQGTQPANGNGQAGAQPGNGGAQGAGGNMMQPGLVNAVVQYLANLAGVTLPTTAAPAN